ncbi:hypothetical protein GF362_02870 [Candidatus Dojkabacteria bacterium]|nr:hypothetical protein [Candidatus Dojkabacteria bacterium]
MFFVLIWCLIWVSIIVFSVFGTIFWILMLIDAIQREYDKENDKLMWVLIIVFTHIIGAAVYYFVEKKKN